MIDPDDKAEIDAGLDEAASKFLLEVDGAAMVTLIARNDGKVMFSSCGVLMVTEQQHALLEEAGRLLIDATMSVTAKAEVISDRGGRYRKPSSRVN
jgi:hypothetical protein